MRHEELWKWFSFVSDWGGEMKQDDDDDDGGFVEQDKKKIKRIEGIERTDGHTRNSDIIPYLSDESINLYQEFEIQRVSFCYLVTTQLYRNNNFTDFTRTILAKPLGVVRVHVVLVWVYVT